MLEKVWCKLGRHEWRIAVYSNRRELLGNSLGAADLTGLAMKCSCGKVKEPFECDEDEILDLQLATFHIIDGSQFEVIEVDGIGD